MQADNVAIYWLVLTASISNLTAAILYLFQKSCGQFWGNISSVCYQKFAAPLDLREDTFDKVTNLYIFPRLFEQLRLVTFRSVWIHDANAQTGDRIQWGWFRLPTKSYMLAFLSLCGITHWVWIPKDLKSVTVVGPADAIATLVDLSNAAANTRLTGTELNTLRHAFGMDDVYTRADKVCVLWERRLLFWVLIVCYIGMGCMLSPGPNRNAAVLVGFFVITLCACWDQICKAHRILSCFQWRSRHAYIHNDIGVALARLDGNAQEHGPSEDFSALASRGPPSHISVEVRDIITQRQIVEASNIESYDMHNQPSNIIYSILTAHGYYYEVVKQTKAITKLNELIVTFAEEAQLYAVQLQPNFVHYLAERTALPDNASLHICAYNPMVDPYLTELYQNFQKGVDRENLLIIILPPLANFNSCLISPVLARTRTAQCTQFVTTLSDFEMLLLQMTAGFIPKMVFVLPIDATSHDKHLRTPFEVWFSMERVLGNKNCHWS